MKLWSRIRRGRALTDARPWFANAILNSVEDRRADGASENQQWQCARAPAIVLMFRSRRRRDRRAVGRT
jgi:hypothetical protein